MLIYKEARNKIIDAYFKDELKPYDSRFCFCGTLCDNSRGWRKEDYLGIFSNDVHKDFMCYTGQQYTDMERALLLPLINTVGYGLEYEHYLFEGMSNALDVLK